MTTYEALRLTYFACTTILVVLSVVSEILRDKRTR